MMRGELYQLFCWILVCTGRNWIGRKGTERIGVVRNKEKTPLSPHPCLEAVRHWLGVLWQYIGIRAKKELRNCYPWKFCLMAWYQSIYPIHYGLWKRFSIKGTRNLLSSVSIIYKIKSEWMFVYFCLTQRQLLYENNLMKENTF